LKETNDYSKFAANLYIHSKVYIYGSQLDIYRIKIDKHRIDCGESRMSEDLKEEMERLKQKRSRGIYIDVGNRVHDYVEDVMEGVAEGIHGELEKSIFIGPRGIRILKDREPYRKEGEVKVSFPKVAEVMSALSHEHRLKILDELMSGGKYTNELQEKLSEITTSTLSSHLNVLEEAGLVVQEKVRGRYLITIPGRTAYKMARRVTRFLERRNHK
jgi:DNA-binding HxlR family transcriptional regulator